MNSELSKILSEMAILLEMKGVAFKPRAYERVAYVIGSLREDVKNIYKEGGLKALENIPGVGEGIGERIEEYIKTGHIKDYDALKEKFPIDIISLRSVEGIGPKMILRLYKKAGIKNLEDLKKAAEEGKLKAVAGLGPKTIDNIVQGIDFVNKSGGRLILGFIMPRLRKILQNIRKIEGVERAEFAGSVRRMQETIGDLDILVTSTKPPKAMDFFITMPEVDVVHSHGKTRSSVRLKFGIDSDLRVLPPESFGAGQQYFTGDKYHNIHIREIAIRQGYKLNEYGLFSIKNGEERLVAGKTEEEIYEALGLNWMPPEMRTNSGELDPVINKNLPKIIEYGDLKGDLQVQTDWTDGENSIKEMAEAAEKAGLEYICITDHTKALTVTKGSDEKRLLRQMIEIDKIQKEVGIKILKGAEVNIMEDGSLDIDDETLAKLDVVGAAVHKNFKMSEEDMTKRISRAMENPNVDIIFHPTGRLINKRDPYEVNVEELLRKAKETKTIMEIDAYPDRLDLKDEYIRKGVEEGVKFSIDSDAHSIDHFKFLEYGVAQARRGWAEAKDVVNTRSWEEMLRLLK